MSLLKDINTPVSEANDRKVGDVATGPGWYILPKKHKGGFALDGPFKTEAKAEHQIASKKAQYSDDIETEAVYGQELVGKNPLFYDFKALPKPTSEDRKPSLIKELSVVNAPRNVQTDLKKSDATDAGTNDVVDKARAASDISFNLMRNTINASGKVTGSDVANYIEKAEELNDEVDTVPFGLETDDGQIVKVYVNAEEADKFEEAMKNMLGLEDDIEEAINRLTTEFDIVDVVWPKGDDDDGEQDPDADLSIDDTSNLQLDDPLDDEDFADDNFDVVASTSDDESKDAKKDSKKGKSGEEDDEIAAAAAEDEAENGDDKSSKDSDSDEDSDDVEAASNEEEPDEEEDVDADGTPIPKKKKKKKKKAQPAEPVEDEDEAPVKESRETFRVVADETKGRIYYEGSKANCEQWIEEMSENDKYRDLSFDIVPVRQTQENTNMTTFGSKFLERVLQEAPEDRDGVKDGFNIPLDSQARALVAKLKLPFAKRLIAFHVMAGVPGRYLNTDDAETAIAGAADMLRKKVSVRKAFNTLYDGLANAKGFAIPAETTNESYEFDSLFEEYDAQQSMKWANQLAAKIKAQFHVNVETKQASDGSVTVTANNGDLADNSESSNKNVITVKNFNDLIDADFRAARGKGNYFSQPRGASFTVGVGLRESKVYEASKQKRGSFVQKLLETVLVQLGLPNDLITSTGPSAVGTGIYRTAELIEQDGTLERSLRLLATRLGIRSTDAMEPVAEAKKAPMLGKKAGIDKLGKKTEDEKEAKKKTKGLGEGLSRLASMSEAVDVGNDDYAQAVSELISVLGIPDDILERRRTQVVQALRQRKQTLRNRAQVLTMIGRLKTILDNNTIQNPSQQQEEPTNEGLFGGQTFEIPDTNQFDSKSIMGHLSKSAKMLGIGKFKASDKSDIEKLKLFQKHPELWLDDGEKLMKRLLKK